MSTKAVLKRRKWLAAIMLAVLLVGWFHALEPHTVHHTEAGTPEPCLVCVATAALVLIVVFALVPPDGASRWYPTNGGDDSRAKDLSIAPCGLRAPPSRA